MVWTKSSAVVVVVADEVEVEAEVDGVGSKVEKSTGSEASVVGLKLMLKEEEFVAAKVVSGGGEKVSLGEGTGLKLKTGVEVLAEGMMVMEDPQLRGDKSMGVIFLVRFGNLIGFMAETSDIVCGSGARHSMRKVGGICNCLPDHAWAEEKERRGNSSARNTITFHNGVKFGKSVVTGHSTVEQVGKVSITSRTIGGVMFSEMLVIFEIVNNLEGIACHISRASVSRVTNGNMSVRGGGDERMVNAATKDI
ncbi:hypothetical protein BDQ17DRAFT_1336141 [Cyathus striatus]|nr:hypothetical protein BDQ17DRAFT_1336141 [Cyathus striatus]